MLGDGSYAVRGLLAATPTNMTWIVRFRLDSRLHDFPPPYMQGQMGRPPEKGERQAALQERLKDKQTKWQNVQFSKWYGQVNKAMQLTSGTALWYRAGEPLVPVQWVLLRDPKGKLDPVAIACTNLDMDFIQIVKHYLKRWQVEVTFEEVRAHLGVETQRQWADLSILRSTPCLMALFSILTLWANQLNDANLLTTFQTAWYKKSHPTFSDAIASVRYRIWGLQINSHSLKNRKCEISFKLFNYHLAFMAARAV